MKESQIMKIAVRYYTRSGNTERLANAVADAVNVKAERIDVPLGEKVDILFLGCSYYAFDMDDAVKQFIRTNKQHIGKIVCVGTSAGMKSMLKPMKKVTDEVGVALGTEEFHCRGEFGPFHKGRPNADDLKNVADFARRAAELVKG